MDAPSTPQLRKKSRAYSFPAFCSLTNKAFSLINKALSEEMASILCSDTYDDIKKISWDKLIQEMRVHAPVLTNILFSCTSTKNPGPNRMATIVLCGSVIFKHRCYRIEFIAGYHVDCACWPLWETCILLLIVLGDEALAWLEMETKLLRTLPLSFACP